MNFGQYTDGSSSLYPKRDTVVIMADDIIGFKADSLRPKHGHILNKQAKIIISIICKLEVFEFL